MLGVEWSGLGSLVGASVCEICVGTKSFVVLDWIYESSSVVLGGPLFVWTGPRFAPSEVPPVGVLKLWMIHLLDVLVQLT